MADNDHIVNLVSRVRQCNSPDTLLELEKSFNKAGLTVRTSVGNKYMLCKLVEGRLQAKELFEDYIPITEIKATSLDSRDIDRIVEFIEKAASVPSKPRNKEAIPGNFAMLNHMPPEFVRKIAEMMEE